MTATMIKEFRLPDLGEGLTESEIVSWKVGVGDTVSLNQIIAEVETAKAVVELPSPFAGVITALHEQPGTVVEVGKPIVSFEVKDDAGNQTAAAAPAEVALPKREPNLVGYGAVVESTGRPVRRQRTLVQPTPLAEPAPLAEPVETRFANTSTAERPRSTPPVRKLAKDLGVDLESVPGSGPRGLITRDDVRNFVGGGDLPAAAQELAAQEVQPAPAQGEREVRTPIKGVRKFTAAAMVSSAFTAPHVTEFLTVDVTPAMELLARLKENKAFAGHKLTPLTLVARAVLIALRRNPGLNAKWDEANQEIVQFNYVNLGIAAATPRGLTVPNIKDADRLALVDLSTELAELTDTARAGKTSPADLSGGTISITNIGVFGIDAGTPILNPGEAAILAMGAVRKTPWEYQDQVALRQVMTLSLSFDHRLVDGEQGSRFLADVGALLADPGMALAMA
ncbi:dihydrolipoamide acetyltransferase family protein [Arthrobacter sp. AFG20]|uniref:dihydrolipoamide acetyltransferase family protein n=1 Tax=Arthrobacter sp. AFG20 TaxID=1688671 RepID=UPI000C9EBAA6|nr:dihydrolipoamide acetyltransferase family protein [Arthrobacter sp. AFG20]PNH86666.1 branched-chain alpha-keto acid dehydrogenase subunit E2 [Arthrobacter sp. AFG20]